MPSGRVVTAGCGLILDRNGGSKNYHLIDGGSWYSVPNGRTHQFRCPISDQTAQLDERSLARVINGNSFDLPVFRYRAMVHGISAPGLSARPYFHRYSEDAIDLCDTPSAGASLESGRGSMAGGVTSARARSRRLLRDRCVGTYRVWLRYGLCALFTWKRGPGPRPPSTTRSECYPCPLPTNHGHHGTVAEFIPTA